MSCGSRLQVERHISKFCKFARLLMTESTSCRASSRKSTVTFSICRLNKRPIACQKLSKRLKRCRPASKNTERYRQFGTRSGIIWAGFETGDLAFRDQCDVSEFFAIRPGECFWVAYWGERSDGVGREWGTSLHFIPLYRFWDNRGHHHIRQVWLPQRNLCLIQLMVVTCLLSIYLLNHFDNLYIKTSLILLAVSEVLDIIWLFMYASQKWNPPTVGNDSTYST